MNSFCLTARDCLSFSETVPREGTFPGKGDTRKVVVNVLQVRGHLRKAEPRGNSGIVLSWV